MNKLSLGWTLVEDVRNFCTDSANKQTIERMRQLLIAKGLWVEPEPEPEKQPKRKSRAYAHLKKPPEGPPLAHAG
jgi:hypothetical protein